MTPKRPTERSLEQRARRQLARSGCHLVKPRPDSPMVAEYGPYYIVNTTTSTVEGRGLTLEQVLDVAAQWLEEGDDE